MSTSKFVLFAVLVALVPLAMAESFSPYNARPVDVGSPFGPHEDSLQKILDAQCPGCFNVNTDQNSTGYWRLETDPPTEISPIVIVEWAGWAPGNIVGLFSAGSSLVRHDVFLGPASGGASAKITWNDHNSGSIEQLSGAPGAVAEGSFTGISYLGFGFYLRPQGGSTYYYTVDDLNPDKSPQVLAFRDPRPGLTSTWYLGFEDLFAKGWSDKDYQDFVMKVEGIIPVPEPAAILLVGSVLLLVGRRLRARA